MSNSKFFYFNLLTQPETETTVTEGGENPFYPVSNLKHPQAVKTYRSSSGTSAKIVFDLQTAGTVDAFLAVGNSIGILDLTSIVIEGNALNEWATPAFTVTVTDFDYVANFASKLFAAPQTYRYWRISFEGTSDYVEVGKIFLGSSVSLTSNNIAVGFEHGSTDLSTTIKGRYGQRFIDSITSVKNFKGSIGLMTLSEQNTIREMYDYCGTRNPVWLVVDPAETIVVNKDTLSGYFYFAKQPQFSNDFYGLYSTTFELEEAK
jgi:hypothetical protein